MILFALGLACGAVAMFALGWFMSRDFFEMGNEPRRVDAHRGSRQDRT